MPFKHSTTHSASSFFDKLKAEKQSETVFIIGGGSSLFSYLPDTSMLYGKDIINTNNAYKLFPDAILTHFMDPIWYEWHNDPVTGLLSTFNGYVSTATNALQLQWDHLGIYCFNRLDQKMAGLALDRNFLAGNNTGHQAVNIAVRMGYKNIILCGFDMTPQKQVQWHQDHKRATNMSAYIDTMIPQFQYIVPFQEQLGFKIYNANKNSSLRYFDFCDIKDFL